MYYVLKIICEYDKEYIHAKDIVEQLKTYGIVVNIKTVYSAIENINAFFRNILGEDMIIKKKKSGLKIQKDFFSDGELQFLMDDIMYHPDLRYEDKEGLKSTLLAFSSDRQKKCLVPSHFHKRDMSFSLLLNLSTIMKAIENESVISFQYINYEVKNDHLYEVNSRNGNKGEEYYFSPYQIVSNNNHYYVIGYNTKYKERLTTYRIDRMRKIQKTRMRFVEVREQFDLKDEIDKMMNMYMGHKRNTLKIECEQRVLREIVSRFGDHLSAQKLWNDHYLITIEDIPLSEGLIGWILMLQDQIKVIEPLELQKEIQQRLEKISILYKD